MKVVAEENFDAEVLEAEKPTLVDFYADWCGPCHAMSPVLENIAAERPEINVVKVDIDASQSLAARYSVRSIPLLILFEGGKIKSSVLGARPKKALLDALGLNLD